MPRPGTEIRIVDGAAGGGPVLDTGQAFFAGVAGARLDDAGATRSRSAPEYETQVRAALGRLAALRRRRLVFRRGRRHALRRARRGRRRRRRRPGNSAAPPGSRRRPRARGVGQHGQGLGGRAGVRHGRRDLVENPAGTEVDRSPALAHERRDRRVVAGARLGHVHEAGRHAADRPASTVTLTTGADGSAPARPRSPRRSPASSTGSGPGRSPRPATRRPSCTPRLLKHADAMRRVALARPARLGERLDARRRRAGARRRQGRALRAGARAVALLPRPGRARP